MFAWHIIPILIFLVTGTLVWVSALKINGYRESGYRGLVTFFVSFLLCGFGTMGSLVYLNHLYDTREVRITCESGWELDERLAKFRIERSWDPHLEVAADRHGCDWTGHWTTRRAEVDRVNYDGSHLRGEE